MKSVLQRGRRVRIKVNESWRRRLEKGDQAELLKWIEQSGLERVARIVAALTDSAGERGQPDKLDTLQLLKIAHLKKQHPERKLHAIAVEVASDVTSPRRMVEPGSVVSKLERDFKRLRHKFTTLAARVPRPSREDIDRDQCRSKTSNEFRALARIVGLLPTQIDLYDMLLIEAKKRGPETERLIRAFGRERAELALAAAIKRLGISSWVTNAHGAPIIPRNFFDLIGSELSAYGQEFESRRRRPKADEALHVGRK